MGISYENQRVLFDQIVKKYMDYLALYRTFNNGSAEGATNFGDFYWRMTYISKYQDGRNIASQSY